MLSAQFDDDDDDDDTGLDDRVKRTCMRSFVPDFSQ